MAEWLLETHVEIQILVTVQLSLEMADHWSRHILLAHMHRKSIFISSFLTSSFLCFHFSISTFSMTPAWPRHGVLHYSGHGLGLITWLLPCNWVQWFDNTLNIIIETKICTDPPSLFWWTSEPHCRDVYVNSTDRDSSTSAQKQKKIFDTMSLGKWVSWNYYATDSPEIVFDYSLWLPESRAWIL